MSEKKFTPGDWAIDPFSDETIAIHAPDGDRHICTLQERGYGEEFREGDAALIVAAPALLAACESYVLGRKSDRDCESEMKAAIAKAEPAGRAKQ